MIQRDAMVPCAPAFLSTNLRVVCARLLCLVIATESVFPPSENFWGCSAGIWGPEVPA